MARSPRQLLAYLAVLVTALASVATTPCTYSAEAETPPSTVELGAQGAESVARFRVRTNWDIATVEVTARLVAGEGTAEVVVPDVWLGAGPGESLPDGGVAVPFTVDAAGVSRTVCSGVCAGEFEVHARRSAGMDAAQLELVVSVSSGGRACEQADGDYYLVVERVP